VTTIDPKLLTRAWVHAHEQDHDGLQVFKPLGTALPPSRGRRILDLSHAEKMTLTKPDASDRSTTREAHWQLADDRLSLSSDSSDETHYRIESLNRDELVMQRVDPS
jgi:hypothetical protein